MLEVLSCSRFWGRRLGTSAGRNGWKGKGLLVFRIEDLSLHLFAKVAGLRPGARPGPVPKQA